MLVSETWTVCLLKKGLLVMAGMPAGGPKKGARFQAPNPDRKV